MKQYPKWVTSSDGYGMKRRIKSTFPLLLAGAMYFGFDVSESDLMLVLNSLFVVWGVVWNIWGWFKALYINK